MKNGYLLITYYSLLITPSSPCVHDGEDVNLPCPPAPHLPGGGQAGSRKPNNAPRGERFSAQIVPP